MDEFILLIAKNADFNEIEKHYEEHKDVIRDNIYYIINSFDDELSETFSTELLSLFVGISVDKEFRLRDMSVKGAAEVKKYNDIMEEYKNSVDDFVTGNGFLKSELVEKLPKILQYRMIRYTILRKLSVESDPEKFMEELKHMPYPYNNFYDKYNKGNFDVLYKDEEGNFVLHNDWIIDGKTGEFKHDDDFFPVLKNVF